MLGLTGPAAAADADAARARGQAACNAAMRQVADGVAAQDRALVQPAVDRLETLVHRPIVCGFAPAAIGAAYRLGLAEPGEGEPDAQAHFRHQAARWRLQGRLEGLPSAEWMGFAEIFGLAFTEWPRPLRDALLGGVGGGERAWAAALGVWPDQHDIERAAAALTADERAKARDRVHHFLRYSAASD